MQKVYSSLYRAYLEGQEAFLAGEILPDNPYRGEKVRANSGMFTKEAQWELGYMQPFEKAAHIEGGRDSKQKSLIKGDWDKILTEIGRE